MTVFLASLFTLTRRYKSISILFPDASLRMVGVSSQSWGEKQGSRQIGLSLLGYNFSYFGSKLRTPAGERSSRPSVDVFGGILIFSAILGGRRGRLRRAPRGSPRQRSIPSLPSAGGWTTGLSAGPFLEPGPACLAAALLDLPGLDRPLPVLPPPSPG